MKNIQQDINLRVQLNADSGKIFLRVWHSFTRKGSFIDMIITDKAIPYHAHLYLNWKERNKVLNLIK